MIRILLLLTSLSLQASLHDFDLTIPEQPAAHIAEKEFFLHFGDYNEPPTKAQIITFWVIHGLDVYTTHQGLKKCRSCIERNPLLSKKPSLEELLLKKAIVGSLVINNSSKRYITALNIYVTLIVINNHNLK